ncbi:hypothetical protein Clacol_004985 [Clathrus columnatus]|uniref:Uncharacterized protein n=1 Tax=Clathrus columnatus TaxID=1419009 RepID=A0AAV5A7Z9_9AGAM|nr:hypothetical protein Clacol_004985 [Clathrus columnatus]
MSLLNTTSSNLPVTSGSNLPKPRPFITRRPKPTTPAPVQPAQSVVSTMTSTTEKLSLKVPRPLSTEMKSRLHIVRSFQENPMELGLESDKQQQPTTAARHLSISKENSDPIDKHHVAFKTLQDTKREAVFQRTQLWERVGVVPQLGCSSSMFDKGLMDFQKDTSPKSGSRRTNATKERKRRPLNVAPNGMTRSPVNKTTILANFKTKVKSSQAKIKRAIG